MQMLPEIPIVTEAARLRPAAERYPTPKPVPVTPFLPPRFALLSLPPELAGVARSSKSRQLVS